MRHNNRIIANVQFNNGQVLWFLFRLLFYFLDHLHHGLARPYGAYHQVSVAVWTTQRCSASIIDAVIDHLAADDAKVPVLAWMPFAMHLKGLIEALSSYGGVM